MMADTEHSPTNQLLKSRIQKLGGVSGNGKCVLYVMSRDQRVHDNHALIAAQKQALAKDLPLAVVFNLLPKSGHRAREHYQWMLQGLAHIETELSDLKIPLLLLIGDPNERLAGCVRHMNPDAVYFDFSPLRGAQTLQQYVSEHTNAGVYVADTHNIVPVRVASDKQEVGARTLRPKIHKLLHEYLVEPDQLVVHPHAWPGAVMSIAELEPQIDTLLSRLATNGQKTLIQRFPPGPAAAQKHLQTFISQGLAAYAEQRNDPSVESLSGLSPYLHFGHISSLRIVLEVQKAVDHDPGLQQSADVLIEEMVVRKELSDNFCYYNQQYRELDGAPQWAIATLRKHAEDPREFTYSRNQFEQAQTHDPAWNAAQREMVTTGKMHGYMRMYWAKKVLEWSESPEVAIDHLIYLNDHYSIDGGDPNGYVGILWSVAGVHDRPWGERPVYGTVRSMVYNGLKRKFDIQAYIDKYN